MNLRQLFLTKNDCYKAGKIIKVKGIMVHSTGANNPNLRRYVGPDDGLLGLNTAGNHWNQPKPDGLSVCVHAFIGKLANGAIATYQTLPWDLRGWHCGSGPKGSANDTHISFEICEDTTDGQYLTKAYQEALELTAFLCKKFNLDPLASGVVIGHFEGNKMGIASNHGDPEHWWSRYGSTYSMANFRKEVKKIMEKETNIQTTPDWALEAQDFVVKQGISDGTRPNDDLTRAEQWTMMMRLAKKLGVK